MLEWGGRDLQVAGELLGFSWEQLLQFGGTVGAGAAGIELDCAAGTHHPVLDLL